MIEALNRLGLPDPPLDQLAAMVAAQLDAPHAQVLIVRVDTHPHDLPAITTAGGFRVSGTARTGSSRTAPRQSVSSSTCSTRPAGREPTNVGGIQTGSERLRTIC